MRFPVVRLHQQIAIPRALLSYKSTAGPDLLHLEALRPALAGSMYASCCPAAGRLSSPRSQGCISISAAVARREGTNSSIGSRKSVSALACGAWTET